MATFPQKIREQNKSLILTIPSNIVKSEGLKNNTYCEVTIRPQEVMDLSLTKDNKNAIFRLIKSVLNDVRKIRTINNQLILTLEPDKNMFNELTSIMTKNKEHKT